MPRELANAGFALAQEVINPDWLAALDVEGDEYEGLCGYMPGKLQVYPSAGSRDAACIRDPGRKIWLEPISPEMILSDGLRPYAVGPALGDKAFPKVANLLITPVIVGLCKEAAYAKGSILTKEVWIAQASYNIWVRLERMEVEVSGLAQYSRVDEAALTASIDWLYSRTQLELVAHGVLRG